MYAVHFIKTYIIQDVADIIYDYYRRVNPCAFLKYFERKTLIEPIPYCVYEQAIEMLTTRIVIIGQPRMLMIYLYNSFYIPVKMPGRPGLPGTTKMISPIYIMDNHKDNNGKVTHYWRDITSGELACCKVVLNTYPMQLIYHSNGYFEDDIEMALKNIQQFKIDLV